ncbi:hypothetical protein M436DRAFT_73340 [Aureobasidium namibiae CBS 147.97]|uniref:Uncharacterized protein n=1 Tax=Aureobasidium namibiae CBS 147.97 TaxID=1043004 RepID=A0A074WL74_9PEZI|nr:uncharacterized protein M436DRAFT_73340 [Aureobasidium namibiae CBS 147.97]KEQ72369.1 hypothetical protein M436DRAFT_73340 [Aureobasidium namibiae CBS 147.97]
MAQQFRAGGRSNRSGRSQADHDVFEGLPVRQWSQSETIVGLPPPTEVAQGGDALPELPMPRDSHQLAPWTQQLLREARRPRLAKRPQEPTEDDKQEEEDEGEPVQTGWQSKKWSQVPSHLEKPEREFLAKRRKGLPSLHTQIALQAANAVASSANTRKTKIMKSDADGNTTVYEVLVAEGQTVEGEVAEDAIMADAAPVQAAPGTVIEGVGIANAEGVIVATDLLQPQQQPLRRKPVPPRRIRKGGPGRGKKKVMFNPNDGHNAAATSTPGGGASVATPSTFNANGDDSAMDIDSTPKPDANDNDEGDDEDGEEGDEGDEDDDREDGEVSEGEEPQEEEPVESTAAVPSEPQAEEPIPSAMAQAEEITAPATEATEQTVSEAVDAAEDKHEAREVTQDNEGPEEVAEEKQEAVEALGDKDDPMETVDEKEEAGTAVEEKEEVGEPDAPATEEIQETEEAEALKSPQGPDDTTAKSEEDTVMKEASDKETEAS